MPIGIVPKNVGPVGTVKDAAARFNQKDWEEIGALRAPAPAVWPDYGFWFNYFWDEAVTVEGLTNADKQMLVETFLGVFEKKPGHGWQMRTDPKSREDYQRLKMLRNLLHIGFVRVSPKTGRWGTHVPSELGPQLFTEEVKLFRDKTNYIEFKIGWRCDSRDYHKDLSKQGGFQARSRQDKIDREWNLTQPWHPYSLEVYRNAIYLRKGKNYDNCLHTAVSIGTDFKALVHFPIFTDASLYTYPVGPITWTNPIVVNKKGEIARVGKDALGSYLEHDSQLYMVRIDDSVRGYNTEAFQAKAGKDPFPERSVNAIPFENILGRVLITRKYWWNTSKPEHWEFFDIECKGVDIFSAQIADYVIGPSAAQVLNNHAQAQINLAKNRQDIVFARAERQKLLTSAPVSKGPVGGLKPCPHCGNNFKPAELMGHKNACPKNPLNA
jgi:hypothetical protein